MSFDISRPVRRSPRNANAENNPPAASSQTKFVPSNLVVSGATDFNFGQKRNSKGPFVFSAAPAKSALAPQNAAEENKSSGFNLKASLAKPLGYKPHTGKLKNWAEIQKEKRQQQMAANKMGEAAKKKAANAIKGVRLNKRAELLLKKRNNAA